MGHGVVRRPRHCCLRLVGTYTFRRNLSISLYPSADQNLEELIDELVELGPPGTGHASKIMTTSSDACQKR
jgi:hypothetical protein